MVTLSKNHFHIQLYAKMFFKKFNNFMLRTILIRNKGNKEMEVFNLNPGFVCVCVCVCVESRDRPVVMAAHVTGP